MNYFLKLLLLLVLFTSCGATVKTYEKRTPLENTVDIVEFNINQDIPKEAKVLGQLKIGYNLYFRECNYDSVMNQLKKEVRKVGGNALKITAHKPYHTPLSKESCHKIKAKILLLDKKPSKERKDHISHSDYAMIYLYRYYGQSSFKYNVYINDSIKKHMKVGTKDSIKIMHEGQYRIYSENGEAEINFSVELGKSYFVQCGEAYNNLLARPTITLKSEKTGQKEFDSFLAKD